jgi:plastocyanin
MKSFRIPMLSVLLALAFIAKARSQNVDVGAQVHVIQSGAPKGASHQVLPSVVLWLSPILPDGRDALAPAATVRYRIAQKNKRFDPQLLVVPLGSTVEFPNLDPFFHNVFSQFNGKKFDLGLYEAGSTKVVRFDHEGVSYLFCNIHPEMAAVVVTLSTPYFTVSSKNGNAMIHQVPAGDYDLHVWAVGADARSLDALTRRVAISPSQNSLGEIQVSAGGTLGPHKNKFGEDYQPAPTQY